MKYVTTKKNVIARYGADNIICVGYADLQNLLRFEDAEAYTSGTYGWNADVYGFDGVAICTGYRPFGNVRPSRDLIERYERLAREELEAPYPRDWKLTKNALHGLACEFVRLAMSE
jgi:hypothetical protein